ncbi:MAG: GTPase Era [Flavobacteriales bacterium]|nr:GTPase Era [Flavobacteriales bacterium]
MIDVKKAGYVSIIGKPNAGKSTLLNAILKQKLVITNPKAQTTRHRIIGIHHHKDCQMVFSDTPGIINPAYKLQEQMMAAVNQSLEDADVLVILIDLTSPKLHESVLEKLNAQNCPKILVFNKMDESKQDEIAKMVADFKESIQHNESIIISALHKFNIDVLLDTIYDYCPEHPAYYPEDQLTDKNERFFVSEIIREKLLKHYQQEIPYSSEVVIESFEEKPNITRISAIIYCERPSQKTIIIGKNGLGLKRVGTEARREIEKLIEQKVFLQLFVKVKEKWRNDQNILKSFGYDHE